MNQRNWVARIEPMIAILNNRHPYDGVGRYALSLYLAITKEIQRRKEFCNVQMISWHSKSFRGQLGQLKTIPYLLHNISNMYSISKDYTLYHITNHGLLSKLARKFHPSIVTVHDMIPFIIHRSTTDLLVRKIMTKSLTAADRIICVSEQTKNDLLRFLDVDLDVIRVVYHGVDHELFKPRDKICARKKLGLPRNKPIILHVGSDEKRKNVQTLINAFHKTLKNLRSAILIRVGKDSIRTRKLCKNLHLDKHILHLSCISDEHLAYIYNAADVFVFPSFYEGFGMPVLEAMASSIPVITSNIPVMFEIVGDAGILLDPFDVENFAYWISELLINQELNEKQGKKALKRSEIFSWERCAEETLQVYEEILDI